jgi:hypothetical protein
MIDGVRTMTEQAKSGIATSRIKANTDGSKFDADALVRNEDVRMKSRTAAVDSKRVTESTQQPTNVVEFGHPVTATDPFDSTSSFDPIGSTGLDTEDGADGADLFDVGADKGRQRDPGRDTGSHIGTDGSAGESEGPVGGKYGENMLSFGLGLGMDPFGGGGFNGGSSGGEGEGEGEGADPDTGWGEAEGGGEGGAGEEEGEGEDEGDGEPEAGGGAESSNGDEGTPPNIPLIGFDRTLPARSSSDGTDIDGTDIDPGPDDGVDLSGTGQVADLQDRYLGGDIDEPDYAGGRDMATPFADSEEADPPPDNDDAAF